MSRKTSLPTNVVFFKDTPQTILSRFAVGAEAQPIEKFLKKVKTRLSFEALEPKP